jgi:hypothetical protein
MSNFNPIVAFSGNEIGDVDKLNAIISNQNILYSLLPDFLYRRDSQFINFDEGQSAVFKPVIYAGRVVVPATGSTVLSDRVPFPAGTFASGCGPVVQCTPAQNVNDKKLFVTITHLTNDYSVNIGPEGFKFRVYEEGNNKITSNVGLHFVAFGYKEA